MSDVADGSGPVPRRSPRSSDGGAPVSGALAIVLAVVAVVAGFFILRSISGDDKKQFDLQSAGTGAPSGGENNAPESTVPTSTASTLPTSTTTTIVTDGATVVVANANGQGGSAATMSTALEVAGFTMGDAMDASDASRCEWRNSPGAPLPRLSQQPALDDELRHRRGDVGVGNSLGVACDARGQLRRTVDQRRFRAKHLREPDPDRHRAADRSVEGRLTGEQRSGAPVERCFVRRHVAECNRPDPADPARYLGPGSVRLLGRRRARCRE